MGKSLLIFLAFAACALAVDVNGKWWGEAVTDGAPHPIYVTLFQEGNALKGTGGPNPNVQDLLTNGKIEGNRISFDILPGGRSPLHFELSSEGETLMGTVKVKHSGQVVTGKVSLRKRTS